MADSPVFFRFRSVFAVNQKRRFRFKPRFPILAPLDQQQRRGRMNIMMNKANPLRLQFLFLYCQQHLKRELRTLCIFTRSNGC